MEIIENKIVKIRICIFQKYVFFKNLLDLNLLDLLN